MRIGTPLAAPMLVLLLALTPGCGDDDDSGDEPTATTDDGSAGDDELGDGEITALAAQDICDGLTGADVSDALGLEVTSAAVGGSSTAQCAYDYETTSGATSNVTIASLAADVDLGGRSGADAFDYVVELNRGLAGGTEFDEQEVDAGDRAVRFSGEALHLGILAVDGHILTVIVPAGDTEGTAVNDLLVTMADHFGG